MLNRDVPLVICYNETCVMLLVITYKIRVCLHWLEHSDPYKGCHPPCCYVMILLIKDATTMDVTNTCKYRPYKDVTWKDVLIVLVPVFLMTVCLFLPCDVLLMILCVCMLVLATGDYL